MSAAPHGHPRQAAVPPLAPDVAAAVAARFQLLSDPGRLQLIHALLEAGEMCVGDLAAHAGTTPSATSHQLRQLRLAGLVTGRKAGREVFYRVADRHVRLLIDLAVEHERHEVGDG